MARKRKQDGVNIELIDALATLERDKGIPSEMIFRALEDALASAYPKTPGVTAEHARVEMDRQTGAIKVWELEVDEETEEVLSERFVETPPDLGRIAAQTAKQVIGQRLREAEREMTFEEYHGREGDIVTGIVEQHDPRYTILSLGKAEALMPMAEQVPRERYEVGDRVRGYIAEVRKTVKGPSIIVSRTHPGLVRKLFELEVPEIADGLVEIKGIAREAGHRSKVAVASRDSNIDAKGACVGPKGSRVRSIVNELKGEKIDIVLYSDDAGAFVTEALSPARVREVICNDQSKTAVVVVPDRELSLAIGKEGQNARLAARLTGWRIDIKSESQYSSAGETDAQGSFDPSEPEPRRRPGRWTAQANKPAGEADGGETAGQQPPAEDGASQPVPTPDGGTEGTS